MMGDINIDLAKPHNKNTEPYLDLLLSKNILPLINIFTRITDKSCTTIDHCNVFRPVSMLDQFINSGCLLISVGDHLPEFFIFNNSNDNNRKILTSDRRPLIRLITKRNQERFENELSTMDWSEVYETDNCNEAFGRFHETLCRKYNNCFPKTQLSRKKHKNKRWITKAILVSIRHKNTLFKKMMKNPDDLAITAAYKRYRNKLSHVIKAAERQYYSSKLVKDKTSLKNIWNVYSEFLGKEKGTSDKITKLFFENTCHTNDKDIANAFGKYFSQIGSNMAADFPKNNNFKKYLNENFPHSMFTSPITKDELNTTINKLEINKSPGIDEISSKVLVPRVRDILDPLLYIYNLSFSTGVFPSALKVSKVIPVYKKKSKTNPGNYRPISLLSIFDKILEKLMHKRLYSFLSKHNILYEHQFGFRPNHSTTLALIEIADNIRKEVDEGKSVIGLYLDLSKAFDTVCHQKLLHKLDYYGIRGTTNKWFESYLSDRMQVTYVNGIYAEPMSTGSVGLPQGSVLGPMLYLLYVNDIAKIINNDNCKLRLFADDTNIFVCGRNKQEIETKIQNSLLVLYHWFLDNELSLNIEKTCFTVFSNYIKADNISLKLNNLKIPHVKSTKYLGVILDEKLNFKEHCLYIRNKLTKLTAALHYMSPFLNIEHCKKVYFAYIYPHITYGIELFGLTSKGNTEILQKSQNKMLKSMSQCDRFYSPSLLHKDLNLFTVKEIALFYNSCLVFKQRNGLLPRVFDTMFISREEMQLRSHRNMSELSLPNTRLTFGQKPIITCQRWYGTNYRET